MVDKNSVSPSSSNKIKSKSVIWLYSSRTRTTSSLDVGKWPVKTSYCWEMISLSPAISSQNATSLRRDAYSSTTDMSSIKDETSPNKTSFSDNGLICS